MKCLEPFCIREFVICPQFLSPHAPKKINNKVEILYELFCALFIST